MAKNPNKKIKETNPEVGNYLNAPFAITHSILIISTFGAVIVLVVMLIAILSSDYEKFYFDGNSIMTYIFFGLIFLFIALLVGMVFVSVSSTGAMPTYDDFKRAQNKLAYLKRKSRFPELLDFDQSHPKFEEEATENGLTLKSFCEKFRNYSGNTLHLYYSEADIRRFIASLAVSKIMILQGMSGTGKTSIAIAFGKFINNSSTVVPVQPMWKEKSDLLGYYNEFTGKFNETTILKKLYEANLSNKMFVVVMDEMNIARVEYYFSEFLSLLELPPNSERKLIVASSGSEGDPRLMSHGKIVLPNNVWFLGTANNDDSTFAISDKVYDRAMVMNLNNRAEPFGEGKKVEGTHISADYFFNLVEQSKKAYHLSDDALKKIKLIDDYLRHTFQLTFGNRIMVQIRNYVPVFIACGGTESEALDDIIAKKILRKLEAQNPVHVKNKAIELSSKFDEIFGQDVMKECQDYIYKLANNM